MSMTIKKYGLVTLMCAVCCLNLISLSYGEEMLPSPGTVIDKTNYVQYKHLFPEEFLPAFTDMWGLGLDPHSIIVGEPTQVKIMKEFREANEKNRGRYELDGEGYVNAPTETIVGQPFYGVDKNDPNFTQKFMWNYDFRYLGDGLEQSTITFSKRRRESRLGVDKKANYQTYFSGRQVLDPKPYMNNTSKLRVATMLWFLHPPVNKNLINLLLTPLDPRLENTGFVYVPAFRRVLRTESSERSTPLANSTQAPDDFNIFWGRIPEFNFKYVGEQTVLCVIESKVKSITLKEALTYKMFPYDRTGWEPRKVHVIDIIPKNPAYPQSRKRVYIDPEVHLAVYGTAWDRAGALWKVWFASYKSFSMPDAEHKSRTQIIQWGVDVQMGYSTTFGFGEYDFNSKVIPEGAYTPAGVRMLAK